MIIGLFLKGKEEIESSKVSDPVVVWLMSKNAFDIFSRFLLSGGDEKVEELGTGDGCKRM